MTKIKFLALALAFSLIFPLSFQVSRAQEESSLQTAPAAGKVRGRLEDRKEQVRSRAQAIISHFEQVGARLGSVITRLEDYLSKNGADNANLKEATDKLNKAVELNKEALAATASLKDKLGKTETASDLRTALQAWRQEVVKIRGLFADTRQSLAGVIGLLRSGKTTTDRGQE